MSYQLPCAPCRWSRPQFRPAAGGVCGGGPRSEAAVAGPPGVHPQPRCGGPHLGQDRRVPPLLREAPLPGTGRHPAQHAATGEAPRPWVCACIPRDAEVRASPSQLWMRLSGALQKKKNSELSYREAVKNSSNDETIAAKQVRLHGAGSHTTPQRALGLPRQEGGCLMGPAPRTPGGSLCFALGVWVTAWWRGPP